MQEYKTDELDKLAHYSKKTISQKHQSHSVCYLSSLSKDHKHEDADNYLHNQQKQAMNYRWALY